jgi:hypothetical protein
MGKEIILTDAQRTDAISHLNYFGRPDPTNAELVAEIMDLGWKWHDTAQRWVVHDEDDPSLWVDLDWTYISEDDGPPIDLFGVE